MKSYVVISEMDRNGGLKLPENLLELCEVGAGDALEMHLEGENIVLKKYPPTCIFCRSEKDLREYRNKSYCCCCADELKNY
ncbi:MAG TPA: AbrB family transcriptional regulator [Clostridia bacterium]|nr:AbrB family transcriptional regulator [Clostridia bacterium]